MILVELQKCRSLGEPFYDTMFYKYAYNNIAVASKPVWNPAGDISSQLTEYPVILASRTLRVLSSSC